MRGYWYGSYSGTNSGQIVVEIDDRGDIFEGYAYAFDSNPALPNVLAIIKTPGKNHRMQFKAAVLALNAGGEPCSWNQIANQYPAGTNFPTDVTIECDWDDEHLKLNWRTNINTSGAAEIPRSQVTQPSVCQPEPIRTWGEFKEYVTGLKHYRYIFRGQETPWRLRTPFHRTGRGDLRRFFTEDVPVLHRSLSARTDHVFDLNNPMQNAAFLHLIQHHGYPTPLLDWTYSPFVAVYFAYRGVKATEAANAADRKVRIVMFDKVEWCSDIQQILTVAVRWPHFSIVEPIAIGNERLVPQQALSTFTTVDDIETYVQSKEKTTGKRYLQVIDLPITERDKVMRELALMGVTAGSLFPGLDGTCEELRERFFPVSKTRRSLQ